MAETGARKGGKKGRKIGRQRKSPSHTRYTQQQRWIENKSKKVTRNLAHQKQVTEHANGKHVRNN